MSIQNVGFKDSNAGVVNVKIDDEYCSLDIKEIEKINTHIIIDELNDTALYDDIIIKASLYDNDSQITEGTVSINVLTEDKNIILYSQQEVIDNTIDAIIPNDFGIGIYYIEIIYNGAKYYNACKSGKFIRISKRQAICTFEKFEYFAEADSIFETSAVIKDLETLNPISNCTIKYKFNDEINELTSDSHGILDFALQIPEQDATHCVGLKKTYQLLVGLQSDSYTLKNTSVKITILKEDTAIDIQGRDMEVTGNILTEHDYVKYGTVNIKIQNDSINYFETETVEEDGSFSHNININTLLSKITSQYPEDKVYSVSKELGTNITLESTDDIIEVGETLTALAYVQDENENPVSYGTIDFRLFNNNKQVYRYITEVDSGGNGEFIFYTSKTGNYKVKAYYSTVVGYKPSESTDIIVEVNNGS